MTTYNSYDAFNRLLSITDPEGNIETHVYDDSSLSTSHSVNGDLRGTAKLDGYARNVFTTKFADSTNPSINYSLGKQYTYDGFGHAVASSLFGLGPKGLASTTSQPIEMETTSSVFSVENATSRQMTRSKTDLGVNSYDLVQRDTVYDIFGLSYSQSKTVKYYDGASFKHAGAISIRDNCKQLITYQNQLGQEEHYAYDANGYMNTCIRFDGSFVTSISDAIGRPTSVTNGPQLLTKSYLGNGMVSQMTTNTGQTQYTYSLDSCAVGVKYLNALESHQSYRLDNYSRISQDTDVRGTVSIDSILGTSIRAYFILTTPFIDSREYLQFIWSHFHTDLRY